VYKVRRKADGKVYVIKSIDMRGVGVKEKEEAAREACLLARLDNRYIVKYYEAFESRNTLNIVMEFCDQGDLYGYLRRQNGRQVSEATVWGFLIQMCLGLGFLHS
jgi:serine/threonine protein kinase